MDGNEAKAKAGGRGEEMSKAEKIREMQIKINSLEFELAKKEKWLEAYRKRDMPMAMDFLKKKRRNEKNGKV